MAVALGHVAVALGHVAVALCHVAVALGHVTVTLGCVAVALGHVAVALGHVAVTLGCVAVALGTAPSWGPLSVCSQCPLHYNHTDPPPLISCACLYVQMSVVGMVSIPGMMAGLLLQGADPVQVWGQTLCLRGGRPFAGGGGRPCACGGAGGGGGRGGMQLRGGRGRAVLE